MTNAENWVSPWACVLLRGPWDTGKDRYLVLRALQPRWHLRSDSWVFKGKEELAGEERDARVLQEARECVKRDRNLHKLTRAHLFGEGCRGEQTKAGWWESLQGLVLEGPPKPG